MLFLHSVLSLEPAFGMVAQFIWVTWECRDPILFLLRQPAGILNVFIGNKTWFYQKTIKCHNQESSTQFWSRHYGLKLLSHPRRWIIWYITEKPTGWDIYLVLFTESVNVGKCY